MPNWKTYESSVRLLSAILAAHPGLKLNYDAIAGQLHQAESTPKKSPRKRTKTTPKKGKNVDTDGSENDDEEDWESPSKRPAINKTMTGRVTKTRGRSVKYYREDEDEDDEDDVDMKSLKNETEHIMTNAARDEIISNGKPIETNESCDVAVYNTDDEV